VKRERIDRGGLRDDRRPARKGIAGNMIWNRKLGVFELLFAMAIFERA
jgi:hypothetical protein